MLRSLTVVLILLVSTIGQTSSARASAAEMTQVLTAEKQAWAARSERLRKEATAIAQIAQEMPALQACVVDLTQEMRETLAAYDSCLLGLCSAHWRYKARWAVARLEASLQGCRQNQQTIYAILKSKRTGPPYQKETLETYRQLMLGHYALGCAQDAIADALTGYSAALLRADALYCGTTSNEGDINDYVAASRAKTRKLLHAWHAPRSARLMLLSARAAQKSSPEMRPSGELENAVAHACDVAMAEHDAHRAQLVCALATQAGISEACADEAEALCDADHDTWATEHQAVHLFEQCGVEAAS